MGIWGLLVLLVGVAISVAAAQSDSPLKELSGRVAETIVTIVEKGNVFPRDATWTRLLLWEGAFAAHDVLKAHLINQFAQTLSESNGDLCLAYAMAVHRTWETYAHRAATKQLLASATPLLPDPRAWGMATCKAANPPPLTYQQKGKLHSILKLYGGALA